MNINFRRVEKLPPRLPEIKWEDYKDNVREEDLCIVCEFEDRYRSLDASIPFPLDPYSEKIDCMKKEYKNEVHYFNKASEAAIQVIEKEKKRIADMVDFEDMTLEEFRDNWPDKAIDPIKKPTFWPHTPEDQGLHPPETKPKLKKQKSKK